MQGTSLFDWILIRSADLRDFGSRWEVLLRFSWRFRVLMRFGFVMLLRNSVWNSGGGGSGDGGRLC